MTRPETCLVVGGGGFLGRRLVHLLAERGKSVVVFDRAGGGNGDARFVQGDVRDGRALTEAARGCDVVYHLASVVHVRTAQAGELFEINVGGTERALEACRAAGVPRFVYASSASVVYEGRDIENGDEDLPYARRFPAPYAETKRVAEERVLESDGKGGLRTCAIRPHVVFGPGDTRLLPPVMAHARRGIPIAIGSLSKRSDFTYVDNAADALILAAGALAAEGSPAGGRAYFITNEDPRPFWEFLGEILRGVGLKPPAYVLPYPVAYAAAACNEAVMRMRGAQLGEGAFTRFAVKYLSTHHYFNCARARRDLGYSPRVPLDEAVRRTVASLQGASLPSASS